MKEHEVKTMQKDVAGLTPETSKVPEGETVIETPRHSKTKLIIILIVLGLLFGGGFYYWFNYLRAPAGMVEIEGPASFFEVDETKTVIIKEGKEEELVKELKERAKISQFENPALGTFQRILVRKTGQSSDYFISLGEFIEIMEIDISSDVSAKLGDEYTLFFYSDAERLRLGIVAEIKEIEGLAESLKLWGKAVKVIFEPFLLGEETQFAGTEEFQTASYKETQINYLNFANTSLALDYAIVKDYLVITTSKDGMTGVIDRILK